MNMFTLISLLTFHCLVNVLGQEIVVQQPAVVQQQPQVVEQPQQQQVVVQQPVEQQPVVQQQPVQQTVEQPVVQQQPVQQQTVQQQPVQTVQQPAQQNTGPNYQLTGTFVLQQAQQTVVDPVYVLPENSSEVQQDSTESPPNDDDDGLPPLTLLLPQSRPLIYPANSLSPVILQQIPQMPTITAQQVPQRFPGSPKIPQQVSSTTTSKPTTTQQPSTTQQPPKVPSTTQRPLRTPTYIYAPNYHPILPQSAVQQIPPQFKVLRMISPQQLVLLRPAQQGIPPTTVPCQFLMQPIAAQNQYQRPTPSH